jgi:hypothetical protein
MTTTVQTQSEYRDMPLDWLVVSPSLTNFCTQRWSAKRGDMPFALGCPSARPHAMPRTNAGATFWPSRRAAQPALSPYRGHDSRQQV